MEKAPTALTVEFRLSLCAEALAAARSNATLLSHPQKRGTCSIRPSGLPIINPTPNHHHEIRLPQEWTY
ncbi:hypothetical protein ACLOJK_012564 [Asimina triloba]